LYACSLRQFGSFAVEEVGLLLLLLPDGGQRLRNQFLKKVPMSRKISGATGEHQKLTDLA